MIKHRRWINHNGNNKILKIVRTRVKNHALLFIPPITIFGYLARIKSLFCFKQTQLEKRISFKNKLMNLTIVKTYE